MNATPEEIESRLAGAYDLGGGHGEKDFGDLRMRFFRDGEVCFPAPSYLLWAMAQYVRFGYLTELPDTALADELILSDLYASVAAKAGVTVHAPNTRLADLQTIKLHGEVGPEHIAIGPDGNLYVGMESGNITRMNQDGSEQSAFAFTDGRTLGLAFDAQGNLTAPDWAAADPGQYYRDSGFCMDGSASGPFGPMLTWRDLVTGQDGSTIPTQPSAPPSSATPTATPRIRPPATRPHRRWPSLGHRGPPTPNKAIR